MENEKILGAYQLEISGDRKLYRCYDAYFTNQRLIASYVEGRAFIPKFRGLPGWFAFFLWPIYLIEYTIVIPLTRRQRVRPSSDLGQILEADKRNFAWNYQKDIKAVEFTKKHVVWGQYFIRVELLNEKPRTIGYDRKQHDELLKLWQEVLLDKLTVKAI